MIIQPQGGRGGAAPALHVEGVETLERGGVQKVVLVVVGHELRRRVETLT